MVNRSLVSVVDDDESVRESLPDLLREFGFAAQAFSSAEAFLASDIWTRRDAWFWTSRCRACRDPICSVNWRDAGRRFRSSSLPPRPTRRSVSVRPRSGGRGVPAEAIQRHGIAECAEHRARGRLSVVVVLLRLAAQG